MKAFYPPQEDLPIKMTTTLRYSPLIKTTSIYRDVELW